MKFLRELAIGAANLLVSRLRLDAQHLIGIFRSHRQERSFSAPAYRRYLMTGNSSYVWKGGGEGSIHSKVVAPSPQGLAAAFRPARKVWKRMKTKNSVAANEIKAPIDATMFQPANASG